MSAPAERPDPCAWCGAAGPHPWEHRRRDRFAVFGYRWHAVCARCHRWLIGDAGTVGRDGPDEYRRADELEEATAAGGIT